MSENEVRDSTNIESKTDNGIHHEHKEHVSQLKYPNYSLNSNVRSKISPGFQHDSSPRSSTSSKEHGTILTADTEQFIIGQRVWVGGTSPGHIAYIGETHFAPGEWAGVVLDEPNGKNDGCVAGKRYFQCESKKGIFSRLTRLTLQPLEGATARTLPKMSPDRSCTVSPTPSTKSILNKSTGKHGFSVGDRVIVSSGFGSRPGILRYLGETQFAQGNWCGIELDEASGKNDGSVDGVRYFECKPKYGIFVPIAKVSLSPSSKKTRLSRAGSRESLTSIGTMNSIATTNTSRLRMQRMSIPKPVTTPTTTKSSFSMQDLIREKQNHIEQLMIERDLDREDAQNQALQFQKIITELKTKIVNLEGKLEVEKNKTEDLQISIEEATFCGDELNAQTQVYKEKISDLEQKLAAITLVNQNLPSAQPVEEDLISATTQPYNLNASPTNISTSVEKSLSKYHQNEELEKAEAREALNSFRNLLYKIRDLEHDEPDFRKRLSRFIEDPEEIRRDLALRQIDPPAEGRFLSEFSESLVVVIKELSLMRLEKEKVMKKCTELEDLLRSRGSESDEFALERSELIRKLEEATSSSKCESERNANLQQNLQMVEEAIKRTEAEKDDMARKLEEVTSNRNGLLEQFQKLEQEFKANEEKTKQVEKENVDTSQKLEDAFSSVKSLSDLNVKLQQDLENKEEVMKKLEQEKSDILRNLEEIKLDLKQFSELSEKQQEQLKVQEENYKKSNRNLEEFTAQCKSLTELNDQLQNDLKANVEKFNLLEVEKFETSRKLEDLVANSGGLAEQNVKLQQELKSSEEKVSQLEVEKFDLNRELGELSINYKNLTDQIEKLQQEVKTYEEKTKRLEADKFEISGKLENATTNCNNLTELTEKLQQDLNANEEKVKRLEMEKFDVSRKFEELTSTFNSLSESYEKLQTDQKANEEKIKQLEVEKFDASKKLEDLTSNLKNLSEQNEKIQEQLSSGATSECNLTQQNASLQQDIKAKEEKINKLEVEKFELTRDLTEVTAKSKNLSEVNEKLEQEIKANDEKLKQLEMEKFDISGQLESIAKTCENQSKLNEKLNQDLVANDERAKRFEMEKFDISQKLEDTVSNSKNLSEQNEKLQQEIKTNEEKSSRLEVEKFEISRKLEDVSTNLQSLSEQNEKLQQKLQTTEEKANQLEVEKFDMSRKLETATSGSASLLELNEKLHQERKANEEQMNHAQEKISELSEKLENITTNWKSVSEVNDKMKQEINAHEENIKRLEAEKTEISLKLEQATTNSHSISEMNAKVQEDLKTNEEKAKLVENEKLAMSRRIEELTADCLDLSHENSRLKENEEKAKLLETEKLEMSRRLEELTADCLDLSHENNRIQEELKSATEKALLVETEKSNISQKLEEIVSASNGLAELNKKLQEDLKTNGAKIKQLEIEKLEVFRELDNVKANLFNVSERNMKLQQDQIETSNKSQAETEKIISKDGLVALLHSVREDLDNKYVKKDENSDLLQRFKDRLSSIELDLVDGNSLTQEETVKKEIRPTNESVKQKEPDFEQLYLGNGLLEVNQLLNMITVQMESLDQDIRSFSPDSEMRAELLSLAEEKSAKLQFDCNDLTRRFESLKQNFNRKDNMYGDENLLLQMNSNTTVNLSEQMRVLQDKADNYQLVLKANETELNKHLENMSQQRTSSPQSQNEDVVEIECLANNLQLDLDTTRSFIDKIEMLKVALRSLSYSHFKLIKNYAQMNDVLHIYNSSVSSHKNSNDPEASKLSEEVEIANSNIQVECFKLSKFFANSMAPVDSFEKSFDRIKALLSKSTLQISYIEGFIERFSELSNSNSALSKLLAEKVKSLQKAMIASKNQNTTNSSVQINSKVEEQSKSSKESSVESKDEYEEDKTAQINFLNSIIADMQQKNDTLKAKITALESFSTDLQRPYMFDALTARKPAPRMFCDICDHFDLHETEDCPLQESDGGEALIEFKGRDSATRELPPPRKYCENCESFGDHLTEECFGGLE